MIKNLLYKKMNKFKKFSKGFNLAELLIAMSILTISLLAIYGIFPLALRAVNQGENTLIANQVARKEIEYLKTLTWSQLDNENTAVSNRPATNVTTTINGMTSTIAFEPLIRIDTLSDDTNIKTARVQVRWASASARGSKLSYVELETFINNPDQ